MSDRWWAYIYRLNAMALRLPQWRFYVPAWVWDEAVAEHPEGQHATHLFGIRVTANPAMDPDALVAVQP